MASPRIIFGAMVSAPGKYQLCFVTHSEDGEVSATRRNVIVEQHGAFFYFQWADADFNPYPCDHVGLRCDLLDPSASWLIEVDGEIVQPDSVIEPGDEFYFAGGERSLIAAEHHGQTVRHLRDSLFGPGCTVIRPRCQHPFDMQTLTSCDVVAGKCFEPRGVPGLQAAR